MVGHQMTSALSRMTFIWSPVADTHPPPWRFDVLRRFPLSILGEGGEIFVDVPARPFLAAQVAGRMFNPATVFAPRQPLQFAGEQLAFYQIQFQRVAFCQLKTFQQALDAESPLWPQHFTRVRTVQTFWPNVPTASRASRRHMWSRIHRQVWQRDADQPQRGAMTRPPRARILAVPFNFIRLQLTAPTPSSGLHSLPMKSYSRTFTVRIRPADVPKKRGSRFSLSMRCEQLRNQLGPSGNKRGD
jgi:hypothetical protein